MRLTELARIESKGGTVTIGRVSARPRCWIGRSSAGACGSSRWHCHGPVMPRPEAGAPFAVRSRMPIPAPNCRWCCRRSMARCICAAPSGGGASAAKDFFAGMMATTRGDEELIEAVSFPAVRNALRIPRGGAPSWRLCHRRLRRGGDGRGRALRRRRRRGHAGGARFAAPRGSALDDALNGFAYELDARDDVHATARYRRDLVRMIGRELVAGGAAMTDCRPAGATAVRFTLNGSRAPARPSRDCC